jgi:predicted RNA binding protein YcfA (HicA-like mRNA interferase family)
VNKTAELLRKHQGKGALLKVRDLIKTLQVEGWVLRNQKGSHRQYVHPRKPGKVTIAGHLSDELDPKTKKSILRQAGLKQAGLL